ncbi:MAG: tetratricopeptide repeat protein [Gemmatimonadales bacterium]
MKAFKVCAAFFCLAIPASPLCRGALQAQPVEAQLLEPGTLVTRDIAPRETHVYLLGLSGGQVAELSLRKRGIELDLVLSGPDEKAMTRADSRSFPPRETTVLVLAETSGTYRLTIQPATARARTGSYQLRVTELRPASVNDHDRVAAHQAYLEAERMRVSGAADSLRGSIERYESALRLYRAVKVQNGEANALVGLGRVRDALGEKQRALDLLDQARSRYDASGDRSGQAYALNFMGLTSSQLGQRDRALGYLNEALALARAAGDVRVEGVTLNNLGVIHQNAGEHQQAIDLFTQALPFHRAAENIQTEAATLHGLGTAYDNLGEKQKAIEFLERALPLRAMVGNPSDEAVTLNNLGAVHASVDDYQQALELYDQALAAWRLAGDRLGEGATLHNIGGIHELVGEYQRAFQHYRQALPVHRAIQYRLGEATILNSLGRLHAFLGDHRQALNFYQQALPLYRTIGNRNLEAVTLTNIGVSLATLGEPQKALDSYTQAIALLQTAGNRSGEARALNELGRLYASMGDSPKALAAYQQALARFRAIGSRRGEAGVLTQLGAAYGSLGETERALNLHREALDSFRALGLRSGEAATLYNIALAERARGNLKEALTHSEAALQLVEGLRGKVFSQELRSTYLAQVRRHYELNVDLLMQLDARHPADGFAGRALQVSERARARSLLEILAEAQLGVREGIDPALLLRRRSLQQMINLKAQRQAQLLTRTASEGRVSAAGAEIAQLLEDYRQLEAEIRARSPRYAGLTQPPPLHLQEVQEKVLDPDTMILQYLLGEERSYLWAVDSKSIHSYQLPGRAEIEAAARRFYELTSKPSDSEEILKAAGVLNDLVLAPAAPQLRAKRLAIVADGALHYVPFAALPLASSNEVVSLPSVSVLALLREERTRRQQAEKTLAVLADPVYSRDDPRVGSQARAASRKPATSRSDPFLEVSDVHRAARESGVAISEHELPRLIGSRREAAAILALVPAAQRMQAVDFKANRSAATDPGLARYRIIHFATHGLLNSVDPELSGIVLSLVDESGRPQDGFLRLHEIFNLKLPAELVVLSACQTGLGQEIQGEGLVGLTRGFMYAGTPRVVASLWKVDDKATAELMKHFDQGMLGPRKLRPAEALRAAQLAVTGQKRWNSPYYWAGFVLQGEWR